jgi:hypothetical protein
MAGEVAIGSNGDAFPLKQAPPNATLGQNTSTEWRKLLFSTLLGTGAVANGSNIIREGVIQSRPPVMTGVVPAFQDLLVRPRAVTGQGVLIDPGMFVIYRGKAAGSVHEGPYIGGLLYAAQDLPLSAAHATQNRIDTLCVKLTDKNIVADSASGLPHGVSVAYLEGATTAGAVNFAGVAGAAGAPAVVPEGYLPLWDIPRNAGINNITQAVITAGVDRRKSAAVRGASRTLMGGDSTTEAGIVPGEITVLPPTAQRFQSIERMWDGTVWRLMSPFIMQSTPIIGNAGAIQGLPHTLATITVPDIGCPYRVAFRMTTRLRMQSVDAACSGVVRADNAVSGPVVYLGDLQKPNPTNANAQYPVFGQMHGTFPQPGAAAITTARSFNFRLEGPVGDVVIWYDPLPAANGEPGVHQCILEVWPG